MLFHRAALRPLLIAVMLILTALGSAYVHAVAERADDSVRWSTTGTGDATIRLYFFWTHSCPHCQAARPFVADLAERYDWLQVESLPLDNNKSNVERYRELARGIDETAYSVPAFLFCGRILTGFDTAPTTGAELEGALITCRQQILQGASPWQSQQPPAGAATAIELPMFGMKDLSNWSLPLVTVVLAAVDSFNPCAFFVLLFLLSLLVNARDRTRMLLVGSVFVLISGLVYFLFMAAWLNVFLLFGELAWITFTAGALALCFGAFNLKDYFFSDRGPSLGIPEAAKPTLFKRMRLLLGADRLGPMLAGTLVLAILANSYELLCTAGFPMVFTRLLTLNDLDGPIYYLYLAGYCAVYVVPLLIIVGIFVTTLGKRKLSSREGRLLKLLSGLMMIGLGVLLLINPALLNNLLITSGLLAAALLLTFLLSRLTSETSG